MSFSDKARREHPNTYFVQQRLIGDELVRLHLQDQMITARMGGVIPEQVDPTHLRSALDVGCGTGGWLIELAKRYPTFIQLVGMDVNSKMIGAARAHAQTEGVGARVQWQIGDVLRALEFPNDSFDLINLRFGQTYLSKWDWPGVLREFQRVCTPDGVVRITESETIESSSPALEQLWDIGIEASYQAAHLFELRRDGLSSHLADLLSKCRLRQVQTHSSALEYHVGTPEGQSFVEDVRIGFRVMVPFLRKWTRMPDNYEGIYQQALAEMQQPDFAVTWRLLTAWGIK